MVRWSWIFTLKGDLIAKLNTFSPATLPVDAVQVGVLDLTGWKLEK